MLPQSAEGSAAIAPAMAAFRLVRSRKFAEAVTAYDAILQDLPERADLWVNRGVALQALYQLDDAIKSFGVALELRPDDAGAFINRGAVLGWLGRYAEALADYNRAVEIEPDNEAARLGRSVILGCLGRHHDSLRDADHALSLNRGSGGAHYNKALTLLSLGQYYEGFREHEWRFGTRSVLGPYRFKQPVWAGEQTDKTILVYCEQGLGDSIQFARYLPLMAERGLKVVLEAPRQLSRLFSQLPYPVVERDAEIPPFDLQCPIMSLAAIFGTTVDTVPLRSGYLKARPELVEHWRQEMGHLLIGLPRVGLSWSSGVRLAQVIARAMQVRKSIPSAALAPLLSTPGVNFVSLQKDVPDDGIPSSLYDPMPASDDMADTAAIIANLDLVITVDSAVAHLAGAMGKPVWVLNRFDICWRWLSGDTLSPWYASAEVLQQSQPGRWDNVISAVTEELKL